MPTPFVNGGNESQTEDFFDAATKAIEIDGKTFNNKTKFDAAKHYSKKVFAHRVVRSNADSINFEGFRPLLMNLVAVIESHAAQVSGAKAH